MKRALIGGVCAVLTVTGIGLSAAPAGAAPAVTAAAVAASCPGAARVTDAAAAALVAGVRAPNLTGTVPNGPEARIARQLLNGTNRYELSTEFATRFAATGGVAPIDYARFSANAELLRNSAAALGLAAATETGGYDAAVAGRPIEFARAFGIALVRGMACNSAAVRVTGWGGGWQSAVEAAQAGQAGWLLWSRLSPGTRYAVAAMVVREADRIAATAVPYYGRPNGTIVSPGDTKAEENAWNGLVLSQAAAMLPTHPHRARWLNAFTRYALSSYATRADLTSRTVVNGAPVSAWLAGWNANPDGTVVNHGRIHPDYLACVAWNGAASLAFGLGGQATPVAATRYLAREYAALTTVKYAGGTVYRPGSGAIFYPQGNDWGTDRVAHFYYLDTLVSQLKLDGSGGTLAGRYAQLHAARLQKLQQLAGDGRSFLDPARQNSMRYPEQWSTEYFSRTWLQHWVNANHRVAVTDANLTRVTATVDQVAPARDASTDTPVRTTVTDLPARSVALPTAEVTDPAGDMVTLGDDSVPAGAADVRAVSGGLVSRPGGTPDLRLTVTLGGSAADPALSTTFDTNGDAVPDFVLATGDGTVRVTRVATGATVCPAATVTWSGATGTVQVPVSCLDSAAKLTVQVTVIDRSATGAVTLDPSAEVRLARGTAF